MMFSVEKCLGRNGTGIAEESELFAGGGEGNGKEGVPTDEVASAVAAVSDEIGDILKDELGDADRADRIGAELADLSAELGLLAGLADEPQQDFPSLYEIALMGHRGSGSGSSSSSWSCSRGRQRAPTRPQRLPRRRPIAKGKEMSRRRSEAARRAAGVRRRGADPASDASDVGADSDSDDQWTELEDACSSDSSSVAESHPTNIDLEYKEGVEAPALGQYLLPLLSEQVSSANNAPERFLIRHEDILQLLASAEENARDSNPLADEVPLQPHHALSHMDSFEFEEPPVSPDEEAALLHYICEAETDVAVREFEPVPEWLLGVYHSWCEISALVYTLIGADMSVERVSEDWVYRARFGCHCRLCLCTANNSAALAVFIRDLVWSLAHGGLSAAAVGVVRSLGVQAGQTTCHLAHWDLPRLRAVLMSHEDAGATIVYEQLIRLAKESKTTEQIVDKICLCRSYDQPMDKEHAVDRFCKILENFKIASTIAFKVEVLGSGGWVRGARARLARYLAPHQRAAAAARLQHMAATTKPKDLSAWASYKHKCDCLTPRTLCAQQRKQLLKISFFGMMQAVDEASNEKDNVEVLETPKEVPPETGGGEVQNEDVIEVKSPGDVDARHSEKEYEAERSDSNMIDLDDSSFLTVTDSDANSGTASLGLSTSSSLDSASELLLAAAAAVESGGSEGEAPGELCRTVRHLMRSIASIERLMDRVLKHCDEWPAPPSRSDQEARKRVDLGLSEVDRKLMAMYRRLPEVHRRQLQVYRKQKKLSTVCMQLVGGRAPAPPAPCSPPPSPTNTSTGTASRALCPEYHLQRFKEVRRKVMHMRDQQLYYHRLRMWLEDQLKQEKGSLPENNVTLLEEVPRRKRRPASPRLPRLATAPKRKLKPISPSITKPNKILHMLKHKSPRAMELKNDDDKATKPGAEPPDACPLEREENTDTETVVGEKETELCKDMKECLAKFANFALNDKEAEVKFSDSVSPPLQEPSPTSAGPMPVFSKSTQRLLPVNKFLQKNEIKEDVANESAADVKPPPTAQDVDVAQAEPKQDADKGERKYGSFGQEIKKAMEECQNIIDSYTGTESDPGNDNVSLEKMCEVMLRLNDEPAGGPGEDPGAHNARLVQLVESMPQILANTPAIACQLSEFTNSPFEIPGLASIVSSLPELGSDAQLTPETLKQIRELKLNKIRDSVKVTKNTAKRKTTRRLRSDDVSTLTVELDGRDITQLLKDEGGVACLKRGGRDDYKEMLLSVSAQFVANNVFEFDSKQNKSPEPSRGLEESRDLLSLQKKYFNSEMPAEATVPFGNSVKEALSMDELMREMAKSRFNAWKQYAATKVKSIPVSELLAHEIESVLDKFYGFIQDLTVKQCENDADKIVEKIDEYRRNADMDEDSDPDSCPASKESLKQITKLLSTSAGNTFDLLIMKLSKMAEKDFAVKSLKFKYLDVVKRCSESVQLAAWIQNDPETAANIILDMSDLKAEKPDSNPELKNQTNKKKRQYFLQRLKALNRAYMESLPKESITSEEWLVMLYMLDNFEEKMKDSFTKINPPTKPSQSNEAEIVAARGLSKIIGKSSAKPPSKVEPKPKREEKPEKPVTEDNKTRNEVVLSKCEAVLTTKGEKALLDSFNTIKSYISKGIPVPESYKQHVVAICSNVDAKLLDCELVETLKAAFEDGEQIVLETQSSEELAKYSAQALRNAKQTLNAVAFKTMTKPAQKADGEACDTPRTDCKWTSDCVCDTCSPTLDDTGRKAFEKAKKSVEEFFASKYGKKPVAKPPKAQPKVCETASRQSHVCKVGHTANGNGNGNCAGEGAASDQPCSCCYCTVFGHAPPLTTPVPRNFNETRERLRSILNKKKQQCKSNNSESDNPERKQVTGQPQPVETQAAPKPAKPAQQPTPKPPALPKTLPPTLPSVQAQQQKRQAVEAQQKALTDKMAKITVDEQPVVRPKVNPPIAVNTEGKVNPNAMEQIRLQQLKQHAQHPPAQQSKPEPIYDLPIHNRLTLTPQQQQQIRQQQQLQQQQLQMQQQLAAQQRQHGAVSLSSRDTSVFSTSSGCSGGSCWRESRPEDTRDLDALLQYIEGPSRNVDRGKKRAKKQRQKTKKLETRLMEEQARLHFAYSYTCGERDGLSVSLATAAEHVRDARRALQHYHSVRRKGKKQKINPAHQAKMQLVTEKIGELTTVMNTTAKELRVAEKKMSEYSLKLEQCERQLAEVRALAPPQPQDEETLAAQKQQQLQLERQLQLKELERQMSEKQKQNDAYIKAAGAVGGAGGVVCVRRSPGDGAVTLTVPASHSAPHRTTPAQVRGEPPGRAPEPKPAPKPEGHRKLTWEQAIAQMNQVAKGSNKEKKKSKESQLSKQERAKEEQKPDRLADTQPLSKKQRRLLAKQQAEEEERKALQQKQLQAQKEAKSKKGETRKSEAPKHEDKKPEKKQEPVKKKEEKKEKKQQREAEKNRDRQEKTPAPQPSKVNNKQKAVTQPAPQGSNKKEAKKREQQTQQQPRQQVINITAHTTIEAVNKKVMAASELEKPPSCSIMDQLSSGVQVADLKLPPGITLTRVQPSEKREPTPIKSVPLWKGSQLAATPTPIARPPPLITADPSLMMFSTSQPEAPSPQATKSKKSKKKAKKNATELPESRDGTKMVTLRNPMFHPDLPPVQISAEPQQQKSELRIPEPIPMPPAACQATITPTSNGMYTIRNPLMSMMHQQRAPHPRPDQLHDRMLSLSSFTQGNDEGYSLFRSNDEGRLRSFPRPESRLETSPNPIGTRPESNGASLFANQRPDPVRAADYAGPLYTPFGQEDGNLFRNALFTDSRDAPDLKADDPGQHHLANGDSLPYFQRLRVGSKLNSEISVHHVSDSKFFKTPDGSPVEAAPLDDPRHVWPDAMYPHAQPDAPPPVPPRGFGPVGHPPPGAGHESSVFLPDASITNLSSLDLSEREIESFKRFEFYFEPPQHKPKVCLDVRDIANALKHNKL